ncbi:MAG: hypothetical protein ACFFCZ_17840 [Promethearchaeota archaeon]
MIDPNDFVLEGIQAKLELDINPPTVLQMDEEIDFEEAQRLLDQHKKTIFGRIGLTRPETTEIMRSTEPVLKYQLYFVIEARYEIKFLQAHSYKIKTNPGVQAVRALDNILHPVWKAKFERYEAQKRGHGVITLEAINSLFFVFEDTIITNWRGRRVSLPKFSFSEIIRKSHELRDMNYLDKQREHLLNPRFTSEKPIINQTQRELLRHKPRAIDRTLKELVKITTTIVLYPVWEADYTYRNRSRTIYVDGLTGAVVRKL